MSKRFDSVIEEWIAKHIPGMWWFDSRVSGDWVGYVHKVLWTLFAGGLAHLAGFSAWYGGAVYFVVYLVFFKVPGVLRARRKYIAREGDTDTGPWIDRRPSPPWHTGYYTDAILDVSTIIIFVLLLAA